MTKLVFASIFFKAELANLLLQARSLALYGDQCIKQWIVVLNEDIPFSEQDRIMDILQGELKQATFDFRFIIRQDLTHIDLSAVPGWRSQQILKISLAKFLDDQFYVILDSKNHALRPLEISNFVIDGKAVVHIQTYEGWSPFRRWFARAFRLAGVPFDFETFHKYQSTTPYVLETAAVRQCMTDERLNHLRPWHYYITRQEEDPDAVTEFALYAAVSELRKAERVFRDKQYVTVFGGYPSDPKEVVDTINLIRSEHLKFFGLHRSRYLNDEESCLLADRWVERGLFKSREGGLLFLKDRELPAGTLPD